MPSPIIKYFDFEHLPAHLQEISKVISDVATLMEKTLPDSAEK